MQCHNCLFAFQRQAFDLLVAPARTDMKLSKLHSILTRAVEGRIHLENISGPVE